MSESVHRAIRAVSGVIILLAACAGPWLFPTHSTAAEIPFVPYVEPHPDGRIDWDDGMVYGVGKGYVHLNQDSRERALRAARALALQSILKVAAGVRLDDKDTLESLGASGRVEIRLSALVRHEEYETVWLDDDVRGPYARVTYKAPLKGVEGLTKVLLTRLRETPAEWDRFPVKAPFPPAPPSADVPWLVIDARGLPVDQGVNPALFPRIRSVAGDTVYDLGSVREAALVERGMAGYVNLDRAYDELLAFGPRRLSRLRSLFEPGAARAQDRPSRARRGQFIITNASQAEGLNRTNLVISEKDARKIKEEDAASDILKECRVIVVVSDAIGGIEGELMVPEKLLAEALLFGRF